MDQFEEDQQQCLFTIGHSTHSLEAFVELLKHHAIDVLVDSRSSPYSRHVPHFNKEMLQATLKAAGIKYVYLGKELGGRPEGEEYYDAEGFALYYRVAESAFFQAGIARLEKGLRQYRVAIMCSEEDPHGCHRRLLVGRVMARRGVKIRHIRGDGTVQPDAVLQEGMYEQGTLFEMPEDNTWKSLRSVLPRRQPLSSLDSSNAIESSDWSMSD